MNFRKDLLPRNVFSPVLRFLVFLLLGVTACAAAPLRVAVFAPEDCDAAALVTAEVSKIAGIEVVERGQVRLLLGEQALGSTTRERLALGRVLSADLLLLVAKGNAFAWVDARTGEELFRIREDTAETLARSAVALVEENRDAAASDKPTAAVLDDGSTKAAGDSVREWLRASGARVLDRVLAREVLEERSDAEQGLRGKPTPLPALPGARLLLKIKGAEEGFRVEALSADGSARGISPVWNGKSLPDEVRQFLSPLLADSKQEPVPTFRQRLNIEALQPFYKGVSLYEAGKPLEATAEFQRAYEINNLFAAAYLWEARCYEAAGLPEFAAAIRRWLETGFAGRGVAAGADASPRDGVTFLGVNAGEEKQSAAATRLSMAAIDALSGPRLLLPESLGAIRDEYDLLAATTHTEGARWETSSGFVSRFTLRGTMREGACEWVLADSLSGKTLATKKQKLPADPLRWADDLRGWLPKFAQSDSDDTAAPSKRSLSLPAKEVAIAVCKSARSSADKNVALLQLLLIDPSDPAAIGGRIAKGSDEKDGLDNYLAHAKRDVLLRLLPKDHQMSPWLELDRIQSFMPWMAMGAHLSGEKRDSQADLKAFSEGSQGHPARLLARYFWLYDAQGKLPPSEVAVEAAALSKRLSSARELRNSMDLSRMCDAIAWLGRVASGERGMPPYEPFAKPQRMKLWINGNGEPETQWNDYWRVTEVCDLPHSPDELRIEAGAALAIQGRGDCRKRIDPAWMEKFPRSFAMASFIACWGIHELLYTDGRPLPFTGDYPALRAHWRRVVDYTADTLEYRMERAATPADFRAADYPLMYFFPALNETAFRISDEEYAAIHKRFLAVSRAAAARVGVPDKAPRILEKDMIDWRLLTREEALRQGADGTISGLRYYRDIPLISNRLRSAAVAAFAQDPPPFRNWWDLMQSNLDEGMSYRQIASEFILPSLPQIRSLFGSGPLADDERAMLLDVGIVLMWGWRFSEAEEIFSLVAGAPAALTSSERITKGLRAEALFHLARLHVQAKNKPAALVELQRCLDISDGLDLRLLWRSGPNFRDWILNPSGQRGNIRSLAMRLLDELRFDPAHAVFPTRSGVVRVETQQLENPLVTIFYRLPPPSKKPPRVMVFLPNFNDGVTRFFDDNQPWPRFADAHNLVLVVPQFFQVHTFWRRDHSCSPYHFPQIWAGQALLDGIREIGKLRPLDDRRLIFHGIGAGGQFASRFARWKPERTGALSMHGGGEFSWAENEPGLQPISSLKDLPVFLTSGETDDFGTDGWDARALSDVYYTILKGAGAQVDYRVLPATLHRTAPELQALAEKFIADQLRPGS